MAFENFLIQDVATPGAMIHTLRRGTGPQLLLLHGYPQTHFIWHKIADRLSQQYTVVLTDLRGYGDSGKPEGGARQWTDLGEPTRVLNTIALLGLRPKWLAA